MAGDAAGFAEEIDIVLLNNWNGASKCGPDSRCDVLPASGKVVGLAFPGAGLFQKFGDLKMALALGEVQRGGAKIRFRVELCAFFEESSCDPNLFGFRAGGQHNCGGLNGRFGGVGVGSFFKLGAGEGCFASVDGVDEGAAKNGFRGGRE